ncbi:MAG: hypothetical protein EZS28_046025, partial [Streblomastix strix]
MLEIAVGILVVLSLPSILTSRIAYELQSLSALFFKQIISDFSGGIIAQARYEFSTGLYLFNRTTFKSYKKSYIHNYIYNDAQFLVNTGKLLKIEFSQFRSITPLNTISQGIRQLKASVTLIALTGISINIPQCRLPYTILSSGETVTELEVHQSSNYPASNIGDGGGFIQTIMSFANIKSMFVTFAMPQYPTWFFPVLFKNIDLIIDQRHVIPSAYPALTQDVCGQMFDCFVDQDVVSASSDLYHSLVFENQHIDDKNYPYGIEIAETTGQLRPVSNVFYATTLYKGSKAIKTYYPNKFMLAWKLATDDSFMRGYNSSKIGARTNIQVQIGMTPVNDICTDEVIRPVDIDQNDFNYFTSTRCYPNIKNVKLTPLTHYLCDGIVRI